jgi:hypothetical protein
MGGNGVNDQQAAKIVCQLTGSTGPGDVTALSAELLELVRRKAAGATREGVRDGCLEIRAELDRQAIEALRLELRRLARRHGTDAARLRVECA